uniref:BTB/POZ domain-containing protein 6-like n=1 Tax=Myxine glutinosa TaxID=7769 RepID=UPI00358DF592
MTNRLLQSRMLRRPVGKAASFASPPMAGKQSPGSKGRTRSGGVEVEAADDGTTSNTHDSLEIGTSAQASVALKSGSWQAQCATVRERNAAMFNNRLMADVTFVVGPPGASQRIPAHKVGLARKASQCVCPCPRLFANHKVHARATLTQPTPHLEFACALTTPCLQINTIHE